eukprot:1443126-Rhodomonas_salina.3
MRYWDRVCNAMCGTGMGSRKVVLTCLLLGSLFFLPPIPYLSTALHPHTLAQYRTPDRLYPSDPSSVPHSASSVPHSSSVLSLSTALH